MSNIELNAAQEKQLTQSLSDALASNDLDRHLKRVWVFQTHCLVADFAYRGVRFAFDLTPLPGGRLSVDLVQRDRQSAALAITSSESRKDALVPDAAPDTAVGTVVEKVTDLIARIDSHRAREKGSAIRAAEGTSPGGDPAAGRNPGARRRKVGILTLPLGKNYGGSLQAYALMQTVRDLGCDPVLINRRYAAQNTESRPPKARQDAMPALANQIHMESDFATRPFIEGNILPISRPFLTSAQLKRQLADYDLDAVIAGSDQVWRAKYARGLLKDFFHGYLDEQDRSIRRISYAASFGADIWEFSDEQTEMAAGLAQLFDAVSVRESSAVELCRAHLGTDARHVLDPTLLLTPERYRKLFGDRLPAVPGRRITSYILDSSPEKIRFMETISDRLAMKILPVSSRSDSRGTVTQDRSIEGWLSAFYQADFVVTDSFHGVAFSILFNRPFIALANPLRGIARFTSILGIFGLQDRLVTDVKAVDIDNLLRPIDWIAVNRQLDLLRVTSLEFLREALSIPADAAPAPPSPQRQDQGRKRPVLEVQDT